MVFDKYILNTTGFTVGKFFSNWGILIMTQENRLMAKTEKKGNGDPSIHFWEQEGNRVKNGKTVIQSWFDWALCEIKRGTRKNSASVMG